MIVHGEWLLTSARVAIHQPTRTAVLADLHLGYAEARRRGGEAVPSRALAATLAPLQALLARHGLRDVVIAGDLFEAGPSESLAAELTAWLRQNGITLRAVVPGNHDRGLTAGPGFPVAVAGCSLGRWRIVHGDGLPPDGPAVQGHEHPCLRWSGVSAPCYIISATRLILPAFSPDASGVNVLGAPRWRHCSCAVIVGRKVLDFGVIGAIAGKLRPRQKGPGGPRLGRHPPSAQS